MSKPRPRRKWKEQAEVRPIYQAVQEKSSRQTRKKVQGGGMKCKPMRFVSLGALIGISAQNIHPLLGGATLIVGGIIMLVAAFDRSEGSK